MVATCLETSRPLQEVAEKILLAARARSPAAAEESPGWRNETTLVLIGLGKFREAMVLIREDRVNCEKPEVPDVFNYAMALWGATKDVPSDLLRKVVELDVIEQRDAPDANCEECLALCLGLLGRKDEAKSRLANSRHRIREAPIPTFSCWNYMIVKPPVFEGHLNSIEALIAGEELVPDVLFSDVQKAG